MRSALAHAATCLRLSGQHGLRIVLLVPGIWMLGRLLGMLRHEPVWLVQAALVPLLALAGQLAWLAILGLPAGASLVSPSRRPLPALPLGLRARVLVEGAVVAAVLLPIGALVTLDPTWTDGPAQDLPPGVLELVALLVTAVGCGIAGALQQDRGQRTETVALALFILCVEVAWFAGGLEGPAPSLATGLGLLGLFLALGPLPRWGPADRTGARAGSRVRPGRPGPERLWRDLLAGLLRAHWLALPFGLAMALVTFGIERSMDTRMLGPAFYGALGAFTAGALASMVPLGRPVLFVGAGRPGLESPWSVLPVRPAQAMAAYWTHALVCALLLPGAALLLGAVLLPAELEAWRVLAGALAVGALPWAGVLSAGHLGGHTRALLGGALLCGGAVALALGRGLPGLVGATVPGWALFGLTALLPAYHLWRTR